jgi:hemerythrin
MKWDERYNTNILVIDNDHKKLFELANKIEELSEGEMPKSHLIENQIERLLDYTVYHFGREKDLMTKHNVAHFNQHVAEHEEFVGVAKEAYVNWKQRGDVADLKSLIRYLWNWLVEHIMGSDMELAESLMLVDGINKTSC